MKSLTTIIRYACILLSALLGALVIAPYASGVARSLWPALWLMVLLGFERRGAAPGLIAATVGGLSLEAFSVAPFGAALGPLLALALAYGALKKMFFDPTYLARLGWSLVTIVFFFILRSAWIEVAGGSGALGWAALSAVVLANCVGYALSAVSVHAINAYVFSRA